jgi:acyl carrier protein
VTIAVPTTFDEQSVRRNIRQIILEIAPTESVTDLKSEHRLVEDLEYHSLALMELAFALEDEFSLDPISEEDAQKIRTAGDVEDFVVSELAAKHKQRQPPPEAQ